jgi:citrate lyase subunit beta/citryl-CoA lyase
MSKPLITLYIPGTREDMILKSGKYEPDAVIIDLEDTVPMNLKAETRERISDLIPQLSMPPIIRINNEPDLIEDDLTAVVSDKINSILVPMAEDVEAIKNADRIVTKIEKDQGLEPDSVKFILMMESVLGVLRCYDLVTSVKRVESVAFGSAEDGDLQRELGCGFSVEGTEMMYARAPRFCLRPARRSCHMFLMGRLVTLRTWTHYGRIAPYRAVLAMTAGP